MDALTPEQANFALKVADLVVAKLHLSPPPCYETYTLNDLRTVLACESDSAVYRTLERLRVKPYCPGKYSRRDVENAMAKRSHEARRSAGWT
jgi:hypothetical protein